MENILTDYKSGKLKRKLLDARNLIKDEYSEIKIVQDTPKIYKKELNKSLPYLNSKILTF